jgi:hypothetical protein
VQLECWAQEYQERFESFALAPDAVGAVILVKQLLAAEVRSTLNHLRTQETYANTAAESNENTGFTALLVTENFPL